MVTYLSSASCCARATGSRQTRNIVITKKYFIAKGCQTKIIWQSIANKMPGQAIRYLAWNYHRPFQLKNLKSAISYGPGHSGRPSRNLDLAPETQTFSLVIFVAATVLPQPIPAMIPAARSTRPTKAAMPDWSPAPINNNNIPKSVPAQPITIAQVL